MLCLGMEIREEFEVSFTEGVEAKRCGKFGENCIAKGTQKHKWRSVVIKF